jgi:hypothetical protein
MCEARNDPAGAAIEITQTPDQKFSDMERQKSPQKAERDFPLFALWSLFDQFR